MKCTIGRKKIAIDFDGTICSRVNIPRTKDWFSSKPNLYAREAVICLGTVYDLYVFTNRPESDWPKIKKWLKKYKFPKLEVTNIKQPKTFIYVDDRALRFTNWLDITKYFL